MNLKKYGSHLNSSLASLSQCTVRKEKKNYLLNFILYTQRTISENLPSDVENFDHATPAG